jgi:DNA primase
MAQIPAYFIQNLLNRIDIVDLVQSRVPLKKKGANYHGLCPFHQEKTPSFTVSAPKQFYHCFGCGAHGNAIGFVMDLDRLNFVEAIEELARQQGLEVPREGPDQGPRPQYDALYALMSEAGEFYQSQLREHTDRQRAVSYLQKRGLTGVTAKAFGLGFAPPEWDAFLRYLKPNAHQLEILQQAGLLSHSDKSAGYDRFRDRIMFPIHDKRGRIVGFGGRVIDQGEPKYLNSPETPIFHKGKILYGLFEAKKKLHSLLRILVVEGYMDVVMLAQAGIHYSVATLGTATTSEHLRLMKQECHEIIFCFDGDKAGREAASRAFKVCLPFMTGELDVRFLFLPEGEDPDSLVQKEGKLAFEERLNRSALSLYDFMLRQLDAGIDLKTLSGKSRWILAFKPIWRELPEGPFKNFVLDSVAQRFGFSFEQMQHQLESSTEESFVPEERHLSLEEKALALLIQNPHLFGVEMPLLRADVLPVLQDLLLACQKEGFKNTGQAIEYFREHAEFELLNQLASHPYPSLIDDVQAEWEALFTKLVSHQEADLDALLALSKTRELNADEKRALLSLLQQGKR